MNFLMRSNTQHVPSENIPSIQDTTIDSQSVLPYSVTLEGLISQDPIPFSGSAEDRNSGSDGSDDEKDFLTNANSKGGALIGMENHIDVSDDEGWIVIPNGFLPQNWIDAPDIVSLRTLDRSFVFPGEEIQIVACLKANSKECEVITPFKVAAALSKNGNGNNSGKRNGYAPNGENSSPEGESPLPDIQTATRNDGDNMKLVDDEKMSISSTESIIRSENHKRETDTLLRSLEKSHYFVRISEAGEPLWSKRETSDPQTNDSDCNSLITGRSDVATAKISGKGPNSQVPGATAKHSFKCCSLSNGDILVILQMTVSLSKVKNPTIEILQFEKHQPRDLVSESYDKLDNNHSDPCGDLLKWILPLDNTISSSTRSLSPPHTNTSSGFGNSSQRATSSGSQLFSHFRSYSMSALPQNSSTPQVSKVQASKANFDFEDLEKYSSSKSMKLQKPSADGLLSYRGVPLERERFSVRCGLEGIYVPGRRWRRKLQIVQPVAIRSFASDCNTNDFLCVQIQNISPEDAMDIVIYVDAITIIFEDASKGEPLSSLPYACVEAGEEQSLPNLALRSGEEHSFILKPLVSNWKNSKLPGSKISSHPGKDAADTDRYAIIVSCRSNYSDSRLFFKQHTNWRPRFSREISISVTSDMSGGAEAGHVSHLPVQVLTLQASNLTCEDLTMTVLAPASFTLPPSVGSMSSPTSPASPFFAASERTKQGLDVVHPCGADSFSASVVSKSPGCTHLWLQSRVPLGRVPPQSTASVKLELLPLTNGIITLDTLQIDVKEKDVRYVPEHSLQINATSSVSTGIL